jgi:hypothetical protein
MARDERRSLARGTVVQLRLRARLLGVKLLVVDGTVTLTPAETVEARVVVPAPVRRLPVSSDAPGLEASARRLDDVARRLRALGPTLS